MRLRTSAGPSSSGLPGPQVFPMHPELTNAVEDTAARDLQWAATVLGLGRRPVDEAWRVDSFPEKINDISASARKRRTELVAGNEDLEAAIREFMTAWKGERHDNWNIDAAAVLDYYQPSGFGRGKRGVLGLTKDSAKAAGSIAGELDQVTTGVAKTLRAQAAAAHESAQKVILGQATPQDVENVHQAVGAVVGSVDTALGTIGGLAQKYLLGPELCDELPFTDPNERAQPADVLHIDDNGFDRADEKLASSVALAGMAGRLFREETATITYEDGRSPFGTSAQATELAATWLRTISARAGECDRLHDLTQHLQESADQARTDFHEVDGRNATMFYDILDSLG